MSSRSSSAAKDSVSPRLAPLTTRRSVASKTLTNCAGRGAGVVMWSIRVLVTQAGSDRATRDARKLGHDCGTFWPIPARNPGTGANARRAGRHGPLAILRRAVLTRGEKRRETQWIWEFVARGRWSVPRPRGWGWAVRGLLPRPVPIW